MMGWIIVAAMVFMFVYQRYIPVLGIGKKDLNYVSYSKEDITIVDTRDYQVSSNQKIEKAVCIPLPYLNRHCYDIPDKKVFLVSESKLEKNLSARILRRKGMRVIGYHLIHD
ncbi:hypothetical protein [Virgibacillus sp. MG-45]|uniref:hypothetical protein n=1 Tax=Virgibacillus sp. MG-45 TaxID=3102791 RepID=UPI002ED7CE17